MEGSTVIWNANAERKDAVTDVSAAATALPAATRSGRPSAIPDGSPAKSFIINAGISANAINNEQGGNPTLYIKKAFK